MIKKKILPIFVPFLSLLSQAVNAQTEDLGGEGDGGGGILIIIVVIAIILIVIAIISLIIGVWRSFEIPKNDPQDPDGSDPCGQCRRDKEWYDSQSKWDQTVMVAWWLANRAACSIKKC